MFSVVPLGDRLETCHIYAVLCQEQYETIKSCNVPKVKGPKWARPENRENEYVKYYLYNKGCF